MPKKLSMALQVTTHRNSHAGSPLSALRARRHATWPGCDRGPALHQKPVFPDGQVPTRVKPVGHLDLKLAGEPVLEVPDQAASRSRLRTFRNRVHRREITRPRRSVEAVRSAFCSLRFPRRTPSPRPRRGPGRGTPAARLPLPHRRTIQGLGLGVAPERPHQLAEGDGHSHRARPLLIPRRASLTPEWTRSR